MSRSRVIFFLIIGLAVLVVAGALVVQSLQKGTEDAKATQMAQATATAMVLPPSDTSGPVLPVYAGGKPPTDNLPTYVCAADAFASYYALQQMQVAGYDVKYGFHLGIVPFYMENSFNYDETARTELLSTGKIDCLFTTLDSAALSGAGVITAIIDESAGADQLWARPTITSLNDLRSKRIVFPADSVGQFFTLYSLYVAGLNPKNDAQLVPADSVDDAVRRFNQGQADAVAGWEPNILDAAKGNNGKVLLTSDKLRVLVDVIMTSRQSITGKTRIVQSFHDAWFYTLKQQFENFGTAATQIANWGHNDWTGIRAATAEKDLGDALAKLAQAGLSQNSAAMNDTTSLIERLTTAQRVWLAAGESVFSDQPGDISGLVDVTFVRQSSRNGDLATSAQPRNNTFLLTSRPNFKEIAPNEGETLAVLPCRKFDFLPNSTEMIQESKQILDSCVIPILHSSTGIYLKIVGSAAWLPGDTEQINRDFAMKRAQAVADYLKSKGIDPKRLTLDVRVPPEERRNITDGLEQAKDRYVEMSLITVGR
ncbi:MAG: OmpA family protein [Anaerolineae bacterium]|nr:OmpA family protein [Anaerolineae bacterium]